MFAEDLGHGVPMDGRKALAKAFGAYVDDHGLTQTDVAAMGGPSTTSQTKIRMTEAPISLQTLQKIDLVMGWERGTSARIIADGLDPSQQRTITSYSNEELAREVRRRLLLRRSEPDDEPASQKSADEADGLNVKLSRSTRRMPSQQRQPAPGHTPPPAAAD